ncbi:hypothetical protein KI387_009625, partial [Taxus chinensis]
DIKMQKFQSFPCTFSTLRLLLLWGIVVGGSQLEGLCSEGEWEQGIYAKVTNPTLSPSHLKDLPGFTRSVYKRDYALITPESQVFSALPDWTKTSGAYLITPAMDSHFVMYIAQMKENATSALPQQDIERFLFVVKGEVVLSTGAEVFKLSVDSFAYAPPNFKHSVKSDISAVIVVFERRYQRLGNEDPGFLAGSTEQQPLVETPGEVFTLRKLLPTNFSYDFNIH